MLRFKQTRLAKCLAVTLLLAMYVVPAATGASAPAKATKVEKQQIKSIVVFPFDDSDLTVYEAVSKDLQYAIQIGLGDSGLFRSYSFSEGLPSIQRATLEGSLKKDDLKGPFGIEKDQIANAVKIGHELAADYVLVGTIDNVKADMATKVGEVQVTSVMVAVADGSAKTIAVTGKTPAVTPATNAEGLTMVAVNNSASEICKALAPVPVVRPVVLGAPKKKSSTKKIFFGLLLGVAVGLLASNGGGSTDSGPDGPPGGPF